MVSKFDFEVVDGKTKFNIQYELNEFGEPILVDMGIMWNKLAKILAGSFDKIEMYSRLQNAIKSEPEIKQLVIPRNGDKTIDKTIVLSPFSGRVS